MRRPRLLNAAAPTVGAAFVAALIAPAGALAGGSAGDQQYTDPFGGAAATTTHAATAPATTTSGPTTTPAATAPASTAPGDPSTATAAPAATAPADAAPTGTAASGTAGTLPYTGYADWTAAGAGVALLAGGLVLRRRTRSV